MKPFIGMLVAVCLLVGCSSTPIHPSATPTSTSTEVPTPIPTPTLTLTLTPIPSATPTPGLPQTVQIEFDKVIPENIVDLVKNTVNQAYWFYVKKGCSPDFHHVQIVGHESALTIGTDAVLIGWDNLTTISSNMDIRISHEMAHVMCQIAIKKDPDGTGLELMWLLEGAANYFADEERLTNTGKLSGFQGTVTSHEIGMGEWVIASNLCGFPFHSVEKDTSTLGKYFPDYPGVGEVAATLLAKTSPDGTKAIINYYSLLTTLSSDIAFQQAFGRTKDDFYQQFQNECEHGFPTFYRDIPTPIPPEGTVRIQGKVTAEDGSNISSRYFLVPCRLIVDPNFINIENCASGSRIDPDGNFIIDLPLGHYYISVNSTDGGEALGWYSVDGLVNEPTCATVIKTDKDQSISIVMNPENIKAC